MCARPKCVFVWAAVVPGCWRCPVPTSPLCACGTCSRPRPPSCGFPCCSTSTSSVASASRHCTGRRVACTSSRQRRKQGGSGRVTVARDRWRPAGLLLHVVVLVGRAFRCRHNVFCVWNVLTQECWCWDNLAGRVKVTLETLGCPPPSTSCFCLCIDDNRPVQLLLFRVELPGRLHTTVCRVPSSWWAELLLRVCGPAIPHQLQSHDSPCPCSETTPALLPPPRTECCVESPERRCAGGYGGQQ